MTSYSEEPSTGLRAPVTNRVFLLGAGFSKPAGLPLASELLPLTIEVARRHMSDGSFNHLEADVGRYEDYLADTDSSRRFDLEEFCAWLDWEHTLRLQGSDTWSEAGNRSSLQLRWAIGRVLYEAMPTTLPEVYLEFARRLTTSDQVLTLNYDLLLERALDEVGLPYRRFPDRFSEVGEMSAVVDRTRDELVISKLHGSIDWVSLPLSAGSVIGAQHLVAGPRHDNDPLLDIGVVGSGDLGTYYADSHNWWRNPPMIMNPSTAKPLARSSLVPLWHGLAQGSTLRGSLIVIGCSLPPGDPYVLQVIHSIATGVGSGLRAAQQLPWPQTRMKVVDRRSGRVPIAELRERYRFMPEVFTDFVLDGFAVDTLDDIVPTL